MAVYWTANPSPLNLSTYYGGQSILSAESSRTAEFWNVRKLMEQTAQTNPSALDAATRFLSELDKAWSILRLYGTDHPAFRQSIEAAAAILNTPWHVSISPRGFAVEKSPVGADNLYDVSHRRPAEDG